MKFRTFGAVRECCRPTTFHDIHIFSNDLRPKLEPMRHLNEDPSTTRNGNAKVPTNDNCVHVLGKRSAIFVTTLKKRKACFQFGKEQERTAKGLSNNLYFRYKYVKNCVE